MKELMQIYRCNVCGNMVEMVRASMGDLVCCKQQMELMTENTVDAAREKHVPVLDKVEGGYRVKVGGVAHPMEKDHHIEWIELVDGDKVFRRHLKPGEDPEAVFCNCGASSEGVYAREYCNLHGLWKG